jgi:hypothetical protein
MVPDLIPVLFYEAPTTRAKQNKVTDSNHTGSSSEAASCRTLFTAVLTRQVRNSAVEG